MPITDLTGYTWVGNSEFLPTPSTIDVPGTFHFTSNNRSFLGLTITPQGKANTILEYDSTTVYDNGWTDQAYRTIVITGGSSAVSGGPKFSRLLSWLEANGTLTAPIQANTYNLTHSLTNLTKGNITLQITPDTGYTYPSTLTVTNGTLVSYDNTTGVAVISGDDTTVVSGECVAQPSGYDVTITFSNCDGYQGPYLIFDDYDNTSQFGYNFSTDDQIGSLSSANGTVNVTTTTGKVYVVPRVNGVTSFGTITPQAIMHGYAEVDNNLYSNDCSFEFDISSNTIITIDGFGWDD